MMFDGVRIRWFGHSMWKIATGKVSIITDPFSDIGYPMPDGETADIVLSSHGHHDHNNFDLIQGSYKRIDTEGKYLEHGIHIEMIPVWHDEEQGCKRGKNLLMKFSIGDTVFLHCGDLGHTLGDEVLKQLGKIDVMFIPVGGTFTVDAKEAHRVVKSIAPAVVFPMHYRTKALRFPLGSADEYLALVDEYRVIESNEVLLTEDDLSRKQTIVMQYGD